MDDRRPDPDDLLKVATDEDRRRRRGQLKIFFGACAGVGKTFAMLQAAHQKRADGCSVGIGVAETHGRQETAQLLVDLPVLPRHGAHREGDAGELDLDGALTSGFRLLIVDELAHTNAAGSRHAKRWQDIEELLDAGIDVYTALNVQHLESLSDIVGGIIGIRVRETVPDQIFDAATDVVLVDLPPDDLLARLDAGKVYLPVSVERARQNFFRRGNLIALRELALRRVADRVNGDVRSYRISNAIRTVWPTRERLMICVSADRSQERLIREGGRLAQRLQADWIVIHVDQPDAEQDENARTALLAITGVAQSIGAEFVNIPGDSVSSILIEQARTRNATKLIVGKGSARPWRRSTAERIARLGPDIDMVLLSNGAKTQTPPPFATSPKRAQHWRDLALATLACGLTTFAASVLLRVFDLSNVVMLFLLTVVFVSLRLGRLAGAWAAVLCVGCFDFFFVPPRLSFAVSDTQYLFTFALMLIVALITGQLAVRLRSRAQVAMAGARRSATLAQVARDLSAAIKTEQIIAVCRDTIAPLFAAESALILPDRNERLSTPVDAPYVDVSVAQWAFDHVQRAGLGTQTLAGANALYLPLKGPMATRGVLALQPLEGTISTDPDDQRLLNACCSSIALALERVHFVDVAQETLVRMEGERLRNALLASVSHDLRTPLTAIRGLAETLEQPLDLADDEQRDLARSIRVQAEQLQRLVTNVLDVARMQSEVVRLNKEWHALSEVIGSALAQAKAFLKDRRVRAELPPSLALVEVDAPLLERVLVNLLDNAAKYAGPQATISIRAGPSGDYMSIFVEDDGPGLPTPDPETLFQPFTRGIKESVIVGVGLGLSLCRSIIEAHGGSIRASRRSPHGASFEIRLPLGTPPEIESEAAE